MAATNQTANIGLNQWLPTDTLGWDDVNSDNEKIDEALGKRWSKDELRMESGTADVRFANDTGIGYTTRNSRYWVIGDMCIVQFSFLMDGTKPDEAVVLSLANLPVPPVNTGALLYPNSLWASSLAEGYPSPQPCLLFESYGTFSLYGRDEAGGIWGLMKSDWIRGNGARFNGTIIYKI